MTNGGVGQLPHAVVIAADKRVVATDVIVMGDSAATVAKIRQALER